MDYQLKLLFLKMLSVCYINRPKFPPVVAVSLSDEPFDGQFCRVPAVPDIALTVGLAVTTAMLHSELGPLQCSAGGYFSLSRARVSQM